MTLVCTRAHCPSFPLTIPKLQPAQRHLRERFRLLDLGCLIARAAYADAQEGVARKHIKRPADRSSRSITPPGPRYPLSPAGFLFFALFTAFTGLFAFRFVEGRLPKFSRLARTALAPRCVKVITTNGDGRVNAADTNQTKSLAGQLTDTNNFRVDVNLDGRINSADANFVKAHAGSAAGAAEPEMAARR